MNVIIERSDGTQYDLAAIGVKTLDFQPSSPTPRLRTATVEGRHGNVEHGKYFEPRVIAGSFFMSVSDSVDYALLRNELFRTLRSDESFYVIDTREPGKRWRVRTSGFSAEQLSVKHGRFSVDFICANVFAESAGTTLDPLTFDEEVWQVGQGLTVDATDYTQTTSTFQIYNAGDITVDPRQHALKITYNGGVSFAGGDFIIENLTTGTQWRWLEANKVTGVGTIVLDGVKSTRNGATIFGQTNRKLLTIAPGYNDFKITNAESGFSITFDFRFLYL